MRGVNRTLIILLLIVSLVVAACGDGAINRNRPDPTTPPAPIEKPILTQLVEAVNAHDGNAVYRTFSPAVHKLLEKKYCTNDLFSGDSAILGSIVAACEENLWETKPYHNCSAFDQPSCQEYVPLKLMADIHEGMTKTTTGLGSFDILVDGYDGDKESGKQTANVVTVWKTEGHLSNTERQAATLQLTNTPDGWRINNIIPWPWDTPRGTALKARCDLPFNLDCGETSASFDPVENTTTIHVTIDNSGDMMRLVESQAKYLGCIASGQPDMLYLKGPGTTVGYKFDCPAQVGLGAPLKVYFTVDDGATADVGDTRRESGQIVTFVN